MEDELELPSFESYAVKKKAVDWLIEGKPCPNDAVLKLKFKLSKDQF